MDVRLDGLHAQAHHQSVIDGRPEALDVADEVLRGRRHRPLLQRGEIRDAPLAEVCDQTAELLRASPVVVPPQVPRQRVVASLIGGEAREHPFKIVERAVGLVWIRSEHLGTLHAVPLFSGLSRRDLMSVLRSTSGVGYERGSELVKEGETGKGFFIVTRGTAAVWVGGTQVDTIGPGSYFGEMAVLDGGPRTATITATAQMFVLQL